MEASAYDLIVVGAGPAGSACAITAARAGARVLLLDKDSFPGIKCAVSLCPRNHCTFWTLCWAQTNFLNVRRFPCHACFWTRARSPCRWNRRHPAFLAMTWMQRCFWRPERRRGCARRSPGARCSSRHERVQPRLRVQGKGGDQRQRPMVTAHATRVTRYRRSGSD